MASTAYQNVSRGFGARSPNAHGRNPATAVNMTTWRLYNPTLRNTATGKALQTYLMHYDAVRAQAEGGSLDGEGDAPLRAYLRQQGEDLCVRYPEFIPIWRGTLMWEVDE